MVTTTHPGTTTSASAHRASEPVTPWRKRSLGREPAHEPEWYVQTIARAAIVLVTVLALALFAADLYAVVDGRTVVGLKLEALAGLVCLALGAVASRSPSSVWRRGALAMSLAVGVYGLAILLSTLGDFGLQRLPPNSGLLFACLGFGIAAGQQSGNARWFADGLVLASMVIALFALIALLFGSTVQYPFTDHDPMTIAVAVLGFVLSAAVIVQRTDRGLGKLFNSSASGGVLARRLVPLLLVLPIGIARLAYLGVEAGTYDAAFATSLGVTIGVAILIVVIVLTARVVDRLDTVRRGNEAQIRQMVGDIARQSKELQRTNQELESFSYSVSHDLRAPIRHIAGFTELLAKISADKLDDKAKHYVGMITESAQQAGQLIDDLLEFSRMGRTELKLRDVSLDEVVRDAWSKLAPERTGREIELRTASLPTVKADPAMLEVAINNLMSNAVKYTGPRKQAVIDVEAREERDEVVVSIRDNGVGFDMKYVDKLFGVFQRLHGDEIPGVGIGLANVKRIVERHGGRVWAEGEVDRGASFHFSLPRVKETGSA